MKPKRITKKRLAIFLKMTVFGLSVNPNPLMGGLARELEKSFKESYGVDLKEI